MTNQIDTSMRDYVAQHEDLRYTFFGGKGGVGKTVLAGSTALALANRGKRVMLASTNPVHSLSGLLGQNVFGQPTAGHRRRRTCGPTKSTPKTPSSDLRSKSARRSSGSSSSPTSPPRRRISSSRPR